MDELTQTQLDQIQAKLEHLVDLVVELHAASETQPKRKRRPGTEEGDAASAG